MNALTNQGSLPISDIRLENFVGCEIDDFAHEIALLSLWLAEHQMNVIFRKNFGKSSPTLPLKSGGKIVCGNAARLSWDKICPGKEDEETYVIGNPPYSSSYPRYMHTR